VVDICGAKLEHDGAAHQSHGHLGIVQLNVVAHLFAAQRLGR